MQERPIIIIPSFYKEDSVAKEVYEPAQGALKVTSQDPSPGQCCCGPLGMRPPEEVACGFLIYTG